MWKNFPEWDNQARWAPTFDTFIPNGKMKTTSVHDAKQLGALIRGRRRELGLTQTEVAEVANTNLRLVSELERGKPTARLENVMRVLATLGIELEARIR